jgi:hypothetical protein
VKSGQHRRQQAVLVGDDPAAVLGEPVGWYRSPDPDAVDPPHLVAIARARSRAGCPEVVGLGRRLLGQTLLGEVVGEDHVGAVADEQAPFGLDPLPVRVSIS